MSLFLFGYRDDTCCKSTPGASRGVPVPEKRLRVCLQGPLDAVVALLCRVRLWRHHDSSVKLDVVPEVAPPMVAVLLRPALVGVKDIIEGVLNAVGMMRRKRRDARCDGDESQHPFRMLRGKQDGPAHARTHARKNGVCAIRLVHNCQSIPGILPGRIRREGPRPVGPSITPRVEGDHAVIASQVWNLRLPVPRVDDRRGRHEKDRRRTGAMYLESTRAHRRGRHSLPDQALARALAFSVTRGA